ncbi:MAG TPA: glutaredoxin domain-containing protein [Roseiflexaceae bacterium]|nr:glutaredoxin domain-containing protein [Roseiflexaceae bacterium]HMP40260.1 glutaredoxin domain-containing protein [Roseiflexaceae bacterium]
MRDAIIVYGHPTCPALGPVKGLLTQSKVTFEYIDIHQDSGAAARVRTINNGNESVPTLVFPDGSTLTEPTVRELQSKLESLGYKVGPIAWLIGNIWPLFFIGTGILIAVLITVLRFLGVF